MSKKILLLSGSPRKGGNSDILCDQFIKGAENSGHLPEKIYIRDKKINYCIACDVCQKNNGKCIHKDDMSEIAEKIIASDVIVLASPIYFYSVDAQLKTLIDRTYANSSLMKNKDIYYILSCGAPEPQYMDIAISGLHGFMTCLPGATERGIVRGFGAGAAGTIKTQPSMQEAYDMGRAV